MITAYYVSIYQKNNNDYNNNGLYINIKKVDNGNGNW